MTVIAHNILASYTSRQLSITGNKKAKATEKLSTGYRINRAADDAAGLQISEKMRSQIRGLKKASENSEQGISLLQVADGALSEVQNMLQRVNELVIQAANDTNTYEERSAIQKEINEIMSEIDRVGTDTEFNTQKIFQGGFEYVHDPNGDPIDISNIPISDLQLANTALNHEPFSPSANASHLNLSVSTKEGYTPITWNMIFGQGNTSHSTVRYTYTDDLGQSVTASNELNNMAVSNYNYNGTDTYTRTLSFTDDAGISFDIEQKIKVGVNDGEKQYYTMSYEVKNNSTKDVKLDFMFNADTAYNNNDTCEGYYINGSKVNNFCLYTSPSNSEYIDQNPSYVKDIAAITDGFSVIDVDDALPFAEKILWDAAGAPDTLSIGNWRSNTGDWEYYDNLASKLGGNTNSRDLAFSLIWNRDLAANGTQKFSFQYGIVDFTKDNNLNGITVNNTPDKGAATDTLQLWIQSGANTEQGMYVEIGKLSTRNLGVYGLNVSSYENANSSITKVQDAITKVSKQRSYIGAQHNRLEYAVRTDDNTAENLQAAESRIRDTNMAKEMAEFSKNNILEQAGMSMLSQANQNRDGILRLLQ